MGRRWTRLVMIAVSGVVMAGCGTNPFSLSQEAVTDHRSRWSEAGMIDYEYVYRQSCECQPSSMEPARVEVRSGSVASVIYPGSGEAAASKDHYPTIDGLFDLIEDAIDREAAGLIVSYDGFLGYPTEINIDYDLEVADDEITILVSDLVGM